ncbi:hypothetical protein [Gloeothece verrucosa]|uniref:Glycosyltransferase RgtA/B/C/D-like domain-containing protein n=1 Tax=Gloeothece verrucosa (strain PCC 7822) TaxID=497965 RepID=E0UI04_GLOV7|nr:hypothetical protein [Gloeothece verrucosa]ADN14534.1 conserved hypothetical protein [Gloeothece verrucosa PCC 7822]
MIKKIHQWLITYPEKISKNQMSFWLSLSLTFAASYAFLALQEAFSSAYVAQDDARQHVFWMRRFLDPDLFPHDLIADYFQSVAPLGYSFFYRAATLFHIDPMLFNKLLPLFLGLITSAYCFGVTLQILPVPLAGFFVTVLFNQNIWLKDDLVTATPRAFFYPLFMAFLYYLLRRSFWPTLAMIALQGLFYPHCMLISAGILLIRLLDWENGQWRLSADRRDYQFCAAGLGLTFLILLPFALATSEYDPVITVQQARQMLEFAAKGRTSFFEADPARFWLYHERSGMIPDIWRPSLLLVGLILPLLLRLRRVLPLGEQVRKTVYLLPQIILVSLGLFFLAHAVLFKLHLPSRYTHNTFRIVLAIAAGIVLTLLIDALLRWSLRWGRSSLSPQQGLALGLSLYLIITLVLAPTTFKKFPKTGYKVGELPTLYQFFAQQPKDSLIASLEEEASNLPSFAQRSVLVAPEYAIPYNLGYYRRFRERVVDLIKAQFSPNLTEVKQFIEKYGIDFWLINPSSLKADFVANNKWLNQYQPITGETLEMLNQGQIPALTTMDERCRVFEVNDLVVLKAACILDQEKRLSSRTPIKVNCEVRV